MRKIGRNAMSRHLQKVVARLSLIGVALAVMASSSSRTAVAQAPEEIAERLSNEGVPDMILNEWLETMPNAEDIKLKEAELEIYRILPGATEYQTLENIVFLVGAHNLGVQTAAFDYTVEVKGSNNPRWGKKGVRLSGGDRHFTGFVLPYKDVLKDYLAVAGERAEGPENVCFTFSLVGQGTTRLFQDRNMINHQNDYCVEVYIITR